MEDKYSYISAGFDDFLRRDFNPIPETTEDDAQIKTPQLSASLITTEIPEDKITNTVSDLVQITGVTTASASVANNAGVRLTSTLTDNFDPNRIMLGVCETTAYQDTLGDSNSVIPYGSSTIANNYKVHTAHDYHRNELGDHPGKNISYTVHVENQTGSTHTIHFYVRWRYVGRESAS